MTRSRRARSAQQTYLCPEGHQSTDPKSCSECGAPIGSALPAAPAATVSGAAPQTVEPVLASAAAGVVAAAPATCRWCTAPVEPGDVFCSACHRNLATGDMAPADEQPAPADTAAAIAAALVPAATLKTQIVVFADVTDTRSEVLQKITDSGHTIPGERTVELSASSVSFGRERGAIIFAEDTAVSGSHGHFFRRADGGYEIMDNSTNGTSINGKKIPRGQMICLADGDVIAFGHFSRMVYHETPA